MSWLIVGLGNAPDKYQRTRHNAGFWFVDALADEFKTGFQNHKLSAQLAQFQFDNQTIRMIKPKQFMNNSGISVSEFMHYYKVDSAKLLVCHDELDFDPGVIKFRQSGSAAGHNGVSDIIKALGRSDFLRLRIGIGKAATKNKSVDYVLSEPNKNQNELIRFSFNRAVHSIKLLISQNIAEAMLDLHSNKE